MSSLQEIEGGMQVTDAESVGLCPWVEFYPGVVNEDQLDEALGAAISLVHEIKDLSIRKLDSVSARIRDRGSSDIIALSFGKPDINERTIKDFSRMFDIDVTPVIDVGMLLDGIVDFQHAGEVVVYRACHSLGMHIDKNKQQPIGIRRCLLLLDGEKVHSFKHPETGQVISSHSTPGSAVTISHGAIGHAVKAEEKTYTIHIQSEN